MEEKHHNNTHNNGNNTSNRGFASMPHEKVVEIAKKGGETTEKDHQASHTSNNKEKNEEMTEKDRAGEHASGESKKEDKKEKE